MTLHNWLSHKLQIHLFRAAACSGTVSTCLDVELMRWHGPEVTWWCRQVLNSQWGLLSCNHHVTTEAALQQRLHSHPRTLLLKLLMTTLILGDQQSNTLTVARLVSESCRPGCGPPVPAFFTPWCHKNTLHSPYKFSTNCFYSPHPMSLHTHTHTNLDKAWIA